MKRLDIVNARLNKLYNILFKVSSPEEMGKHNLAELEVIKNEIRKYEKEKTMIFQRTYDKNIKQLPGLKENNIYQRLLTNNVEFNSLLLELIAKCPKMVMDMNLLMPIVNFINGGNKLLKIRELLTINRNVLADANLLSRINDECYPQIKDFFKSITLMSSPRFREFLANTQILKDRTYDDVRLVEKAFKEGLNLDLALALGSSAHAKDFLNRNMSKELLDHVNMAKTKSLKKQILAIMFDCNDDKILSILVRFFEIDTIREQLLDENSFYYKLLIAPIYKGVSHKEYALIVPTDETSEYYAKNISMELLDGIAKSSSKILKKQMLAMMFNCNDDAILEELILYVEIDSIKSQLLDENSFYYNLLIKPIKENICYDDYKKLLESDEACQYVKKTLSMELLDSIAKSSSRPFKKQMLSMIYDCNDDIVLDKLAQFIEVDDVRRQLFDQNSFYYNLLIKPIYEGRDLNSYGSVDEVLSTCSSDFDNSILDYDNTDILSHSFDCITGPYIYYYRNNRVNAVPVAKFTQSFNDAISAFYRRLSTISKMNYFSPSNKYGKFLDDDLRAVATNALIDNENKKLKKEELRAWDKYIDETYNNNLDNLDYEIYIGYGLDSFEDTKPKNLSYTFYWNNKKDKKSLVS